MWKFIINYLYIMISAPGTYCPEKVRLDNAPQFSFGLRPPLEKPSDTPGIYQMLKTLELKFCRPDLFISLVETSLNFPLFTNC